MKLIIDIPEKVYAYIQSEWEEYDFDSVINHSLNGIKRGTLLPKNHGRLIDADELIQDIIDDNQLCIFNSGSERIIHDKMVDFAVDRIADAPTIIEGSDSNDR